jgi:hypothetical protein
MRELLSKGHPLKYFFYFLTLIWILRFLQVVGQIEEPLLFLLLRFTVAIKACAPLDIIRYRRAEVASEC